MLKEANMKRIITIITAALAASIYAESSDTLPILYTGDCPR